MRCCCRWPSRNAGSPRPASGRSGPATFTFSPGAAPSGKGWSGGWLPFPSGASTWWTQRESKGYGLCSVLRQPPLHLAAVVAADHQARPLGGLRRFAAAEGGEQRQRVVGELDDLERRHLTLRPRALQLQAGALPGRHFGEVGGGSLHPLLQPRGEEIAEGDGFGQVVEADRRVPAPELGDFARQRLFAERGAGERQLAHQLAEP